MTGRGRAASRRPIALHRSWFIDGELPLGALCSVALGGLDPSEQNVDLPTTIVRLRLQVDTPFIAPDVSGEVMATCSATSVVRSVVHLEAADGAGAATAEVDLGVRAPLVSRRPHPVLRADDVLPYVGRRPGTASWFDVRPLPFTGDNVGTSEAWIRPRSVANGALPGVLLALDSWLPAFQLDHARRLMAGVSQAEELPLATLETATVYIDLAHLSPSDERWLHLGMSVVDGPPGVVRERGALRTEAEECIVWVEVDRRPGSDQTG